MNFSLVSDPPQAPAHGREANEGETPKQCFGIKEGGMLPKANYYFTVFLPATLASTQTQLKHIRKTCQSGFGKAEVKYE